MASNSSVLESQSTVTPSESISVASGTPLIDTDSSTNASESARPGKRRKKERKRNPVWNYARKARRGIEHEKERSGQSWRKVFYCVFPDCEAYSTLSTVSAQLHLRSKHNIDLNNTTRAPSIRAQPTIRSALQRQHEERHQKDEKLALFALQKAADPASIHQNLLRLIINRDLPLSLVEWPEFHALVQSINSEASKVIWKSHNTTASKVEKTFEKSRLELKEFLQQSKSLIHITTDTWHAPNNKELQAITGHWVNKDSTLRKALLSLPEMEAGHSGKEVAIEVFKTLDYYNIKERLGYVTADNHGANNTLCSAIHEELDSWNPKERRLRCVGHMINLAVQSFLFAKSKEAVELALQDAEQSQTAIDEELLQRFNIDDEAGWVATPALQKVLQFVTTLRRSDGLFNGFKRSAGKAIRAPNDTRWNSYLNTLEDALQLKVEYTAFVFQHQELLEYELSAADWSIIEETIHFLRPFKEATKACEGDQVSLDQVQLQMDGLRQHFIDQRAQQVNNPAMLGSIITSWYAFDKYYSLIDDTGAYTLAALLNPNCRKSYLNASWQAKWVTAGLSRAREVWIHYKKEPEEPEKDLSHLTQFERYMAGIQAKQRKGKGGQADEFERFVNAPSDNIDISALEWWLQPLQQRSYPQLSQLAIDVLSAPAMSAESERVFSAARRTIPWSRARLSAPTIERLECLKH
jgi:hypothetical protein